MTAVDRDGPRARFIFLLVVVALLVRIAVIPFLIGEIVDPERDYWTFGCEEGRIARSIAAGEGFSSPLFGKTGPTSWSAPVYPYLLAGVFRVFGVYSRESAWAILSLNALFSALTCIPIVYLMYRIFGNRAAQISGWAWVFFPYAIYYSASHVWGHCLDALLLMTVLWATYEMENQRRLTMWALYGMLWGIAALENPVILATLPALLMWLGWRRHKLAAPSYAAMAVTVAALCLTVSPWFVRNYRTFGRFIPFRGPLSGLDQSRAERHGAERIQPARRARVLRGKTEAGARFREASALALPAIDGAADRLHMDGILDAAPGLPCGGALRVSEYGGVLAADPIHDRGHTPVVSERAEAGNSDLAGIGVPPAGLLHHPSRDGIPPSARSVGGDAWRAMCCRTVNAANLPEWRADRIKRQPA